MNISYSHVCNARLFQNDPTAEDVVMEAKLLGIHEELKNNLRHLMEQYKRVFPTPSVLDKVPTPRLDLEMNRFIVSI